MTDFLTPLILGLDASSLTMSLIAIASPEGDTTALAGASEAALRAVPHLDVTRDGGTVVARTGYGHGERVLLVGRLATGPLDDAPAARVEMGTVFGPGAAVAKGALAVLLKAVAATGHRRDVTAVLSPDGTVRAQDLQGVGLVVLAEPTGGAVAGVADDVHPDVHPDVSGLVELSGADAVAATGALRDRLQALGVPAVAFGPGVAAQGGLPAESVRTADLGQCEFALRRWLTG